MSDNTPSPDSRSENDGSPPLRSRRSILAATGVACVVGPAAALAIGKPATPKPELAVERIACGRLRVTNVGQSHIRVRIEGPNGVRVPETGGLILAPSERHLVTLSAVDGIRGTYRVLDDETDEVLGTVEMDTCVTYYQVQFVQGPPKAALGRDVDDFYAQEQRLIRYLHGTSKQAITSGGRPGDEAVPGDVEACLEMETGVQLDDDEAFVAFTVKDGCEFELSLSSTLAPDDSFDRTERQTVFDTDTGTFGPGRHELRVKLPLGESG